MDILLLIKEWIPKIGYDILKFLIKKFRLRSLTKKRTERMALQPSKQEQIVQVAPPPNKLETFLRLFNECRTDALTHSEIAEACQIESTNLVEQYFSGKVEAPISFQKELCKRYNVNPNWLIHGKERPFSHFQKVFQEAHNSASFIAEFSPTTIFFVKTKSDYSPFCLVLQKSDDYAIIHKSCNWMISDKTGSGGQGQTTSLYVLIKWLLRGRYIQFSVDDVKEIWFGIHCSFYGVELENDDLFNDLIYGAVHPGFLDAHLIRHCTSYWWEDFTDLHGVNFSKERYAFRYGTQFVKAQEIVEYTLNHTMPSYGRLLRTG